MYTQLSGSDIELLNAGDRQLSSFELEGKSEQIVTTSSSNICPPPTDPNWVFTGDAYVDEDGNIQLPTLGDTAYVIVPWNKRANTLNITYTLVFGGGLYLSVGYLDDEKNMISGNGYAIVDKEDNYSSGTNFGGTNEYGDALASATYIALTFMRGDVYGNNPYAVTNLSISISDQEYIPFVPPSPSPRYPSEIKSVGYENLFNGEFRQGSEGTSENLQNLFSKNDLILSPGTYTFTCDLPLDTYKYAIGTSQTGFPGTATYIDGFHTTPSYIFTLSEELHIGILINGNGTNITLDDIINFHFQITKGTKQHSCIPYGKYGIEIEITNGMDTNKSVIVLTEPLRSLPSGIKDTLFIENNMLYVNRTTGSIILNGTEEWDFSTDKAHTFATRMYQIIGKNGKGRSTHFEGISGSDFDLKDGIYTSYSSSIIISYLEASTVEEFKTWLLNNNVQVDYELETPVIEELGEIEMPITFEGTNYITTTDEIKPNMILEYFKGFSDEDKQAIKDSAIAVESKIIVKATDTLPEIVLTDNDSIKDWEYGDERYVPQQGFIGQFVARTLSGNLQDISDDFNIENREIELQLGILHLGTDKTSWYTFGNFIVTNPEGDEVTDNTKFEAMDYTKRFNTEFNGNFTNDIFDKSYNSIVLVDETTGEPQGSVTALWLARYTCAQAGVEFGQNSFTNSDYVIDFNPYQAGETCRDVMKDIAKLAFSWVRVDVDNKCYIDFNESNTIENEYNTLTNNEYYSLETKKEVYGPINRVYIGMSNIDGESILVAEDKDDVATNGKKELYIYDNQLTYSPELRALIADNHSADKLLGLTYAHLTTETIGHPWLLGKEFITILDMEDNECKTYPFNRILKFNGHIKSTIDSMGESEVEATLSYESDVVKNAKNAMVLVKKHEAEIELVATDVTTVQTNLKENYYSKEETNQTIIDTASGLTNKYITAGGNNRFRNTGLYFKDGSDFEYWDGTVDVTTELESATQTAMLLQEGDVSQLVSGLPNNTYTVSFKYKKLIEGSSAYVILNQTKFDLGSEGTFEQVLEVNSNNIEILFHCDTNGGYEIYELMGNVGETALVWTQHPDEISTDTVSISKGITITSSTTDAVFKADADGIRIENKSKNTTTEFLDNGMSTNDAEIKGQAKVSGALFTKVGNQTWISGI